MDTRHRHHKPQLRKVFFGGSQNQGFQIGFAQCTAVYVEIDDAELFSSIFTRLSVHGGKYLFFGCVHTFISCYSIFISGSNAGRDKGLVDIHSTADAVNDFGYNTFPRNSI